jgi:hypothetical protein
MRVLQWVLLLMLAVPCTVWSQDEDDEHSPRWRVKTLSDRDTVYVRFDTIIKATIRD